MTHASMMFLTLAIIVLTTFVITAGAVSGPNPYVPAGTGSAAPGQIRPVTQTGVPGKSPAGGLSGGALNAPARAGQQQGAGITVGDLPGTKTGGSPTDPIGGGPGGPGTCQCIRAPCDCGGTSGGPPDTTKAVPYGSQLPPANQPKSPMNQPIPTPSPWPQSYQTQRTQPLTNPTGPASNFAPGNIQSRRF